MPSEQNSVTVRAVCVVRGGENNVIQGVIHFAQMIGINQLKITGEIQGLPVDRKLTFQVNEYGDLTTGPQSTGNRFNPEKKSSKDTTIFTNDNYGTLQITAEGQAKIDIIDKRLTLFGPSSIIGRSVIIIDEKDDESARVETEENKIAVSTNTNRLAAGVIGICQ